MKRFILTFAALLLLATPAFAQRTVTQGATDQSVELLIIDETTGVPETGVLFNTAGIDLWYRRGNSAKVSITEVTGGSLTTHVDNTITEVQSGVYEFDAPDACFASGASHVTFGGNITGMIVRPVTVQLTAFDLQSPVVRHTGNDATSGTAAKTAIEAAAAGSMVTLGSGVFDLAGNTITIPAGVKVVGSGIDATTIKSIGQSAEAMISSAGARAQISDLTLNSRLGNTAGTPGPPLGWISVAHVGDFRATRVRLVGIHETVTVLFEAGTSTDLFLENCLHEALHQGVGSNVENLILASTTGETRVFVDDCRLLSECTGTSSPIGILLTGVDIEAYVSNSRIDTVNSAANAHGFKDESVSGCQVHFDKTRLRTVASSGAVDIERTAATVTVEQSWYDTTSGTVTVVGADLLATETQSTTAATQATAANTRVQTGVPNALPGAASGVLIAGNNAATTFATLTSTGALSINGTSHVAQTGDSFNRIGVNGAGLTGLASAADLATLAGYVDSEVAAIKIKTDLLPSVTSGQAGGLFIAGSNAATTVASLTSTGAFTVNGVVVGSTLSAILADTEVIGTPAGASLAADVAALPTTEPLDAAATRAALGMAAADLDTQLDGLEPGTTQPRSNRKPAPGFSFKVSRRADGTYECPLPLRIAPGSVENVFPFIDLSPLFGDINVKTVGTPVISGGSIAVTADAPRDTGAFIEVGGTATASEEQTITVPITMDTLEVVQVKLRVEVFAE